LKEDHEQKITPKPILIDYVAKSLSLIEQVHGFGMSGSVAETKILVAS
jgi:hypothetical protein